jgi:long-chain acyl-CoA synthetase
MMLSIPARLQKLGTDPATKDKPGYYSKKNGTYQSETFGSYYNSCLAFAKSLLAIDFSENAKICILAFNRPEWIVSDVGTMLAGGVPAGIYQTCSPEEVSYIVSHSEAEIVVVENQDQWKKVQANVGSLPNLKHIVVMQGSDPSNWQDVDERTLSWDAFLSLGSSIPEDQVQSRLDGLEPNRPATFIYTSGTTGPPKAVMLSHENLTFTADRAVSLTELHANDCTISYLPLSHIAEQVFTIHGPITAGSPVYFAESIEKLPDNLKEVRPTVFFGVPRIWEKFHAGISGKLGLATGFKEKLASWAMKVGRAYHSNKNANKEPAFSLSMQYKLANKLIYSKVKPAIGMDRARVCVSGAAPISQEILEFMSGLDLVIHEVYGQSEDSGPTSFNRPGKTKFGSVGPAFPEVEIKLAEDEEILVRGKNVFLGYYKDKEATDKTLIDGWLHSGDLGKIDEEGYLYIIGRKKEIIITAGGKNISPKNIESDIKDIPIVSQAVVIGDRRKYLSAIITLDMEAIGNVKNAHEDTAIREKLQKGIDVVNSRLARVENVRKFKILPRDFTIEDGELTPTLKIKRRIVYENWSDTIESIYAEDQ